METTLKSPIGVINIMDESGHQQVNWNMSQAQDIAAAQKTFDRLISRGYAAFGSSNRLATKHPIRTFDPTMEEVVMVPRIVGG